MKTKLLFVLGTRPEAIKMAPIIQDALKDQRFEVLVCSTGQHREMLKPVFEVFGFRPQIDFDLMRPGQSLSDISSAVLLRMQSLLFETKPDWVLVQGDTTSAMAASMAAFYQKVPVVHVEAGLRTNDINSPFPEEFNRRVTSLITRLHIAPTEDAANHLKREGIDEASIEITGNTCIDALLRAKAKIDGEAEIKKRLEEKFSFLDEQKKMILTTLHRRESFGAPMESIMNGILDVASRSDLEFLIPLHLNPQVRGTAKRVFGSHAKWVGDSGSSKIWLIEPLEYLDFVYCMSRSYFILSDSGGVQEEAPSLGKPVLVVRENTERPEAVRAGTSKLIGSQRESVVREMFLLLENQDRYKAMARTHNPYGDGKASSRILDAIVAATFLGGRP